MPPTTRTGFFYLIFLFLRRMPAVWAGGFGASIVTLILLSEFGKSAAAAGAILILAAAVGVTLAVDRRRGIGRRMLFRGPVVSARRVAALVVATGLIASVTTAIAANIVVSMRKMEADEIRRPVTWGAPGAPQAPRAPGRE
jgi:hypothetical protein